MELLNYAMLIGSLVCFVLVLIKMFQNGYTALGIACIPLGCCGIGLLIAFVFGWIKSREWNLTTVMLVWSAIVVINIILGIMFPVQIPNFQAPNP